MAYLKGPYTKQANRPPLTTKIVSSRKLNFAARKYETDANGNPEDMDDTANRAVLTYSYGAGDGPRFVSGREFQRRETAVRNALAGLEDEGVIELTSVEIDADAPGSAKERTTYENRARGRQTKTTTIAAESYYFAEVVDTFTSSDTWTRPSGVNDATVECWGAGGGGSAAVGGGGGGAYAAAALTRLTAASYTVTVGTGAANADGGDSSFDTLVAAKGGLSGTNGGTGGQASASTGDTSYDGADGVLGSGLTAGGGGAGDSAAGSGSVGGATNGGHSDQGASGRSPAGGGGSSGVFQGTGARGEVRVTYSALVSSGYPTIVARSWGRDTISGTSHSVTLPSGIESGDLLLAFWACDSDEDGAGDHEASAGWTRLDIDTNTGIVGAVYYKIADGSDSLTITTTDGELGCFVCMRIVNAGTPESTSTNSSGTNADPPLHTPSGGSAKYLWVAAAAFDANAVLDVTAGPGGYSSLINQPQLSGAGVRLAVANFKSESSSENPGTFTSTTEQWVAFTVSVPYSAT